MSISLVIVLRTRYFLQQPTKAKKGEAETSWTIGKRNSFFCRRNACLAADTTLFVDYLCDFGEYNYCIMFWNKFWIEERLKIYFDTILHVIGPRVQIHKSGLINIGPRLQPGDNKRCTYRKKTYFLGFPPPPASDPGKIKVQKKILEANYLISRPPFSLWFSHPTLASDFDACG